MINKILSNIKNKDDKLMIANVIDKYELFKINKINKINGFFNERELLLLTNTLNYLNIKYFVYKYSLTCELSIVSFIEIDKYLFFDIIEIDFPFNSIKHQDILGSLFNLGLKRELIGDIFVLDSRAYIVSLSNYTSIILDSLLTVKNIKVLPHILTEKIELKKDYLVFNIIIASIRLDNVVSKLLKISRNKATNYIAKKEVLVNYAIETNVSRLLRENDILSIRGNGKYIIGVVINKTKSDNIILQIKKYNN